MLKGLMAGGITLGIAAVFPQALVLPFFAAMLGLTLGVGPGLAMGNPELGRVGVEWVATLMIMGLGMIGLWGFPLLLAVAWGLHGFWSLLRHLTTLGDGQREGYARFCITFDLVLGGFVAYIWVVGS